LQHQIRMKKTLIAVVLILCCRLSFAQFKQEDIMTVLPDSTGKELFSDFLGIRLWAADYSINTINQNLNFRYVSSNTGEVLQHSIYAKGLNHCPNFGIGVEENLGEHLIIHFIDASVGYSQYMWNWNIGGGIGYFAALDKKRNLRLRASFELFYEGISYGLGSYADSTQQGFVVNGNNIGTVLNDVKYVNNDLCSSVTASLMYRTKELDYFAGASWNYNLLTSENINFYSTRVVISNAIYNQAGQPVNGNILKLGSYMIQIGIIREFGL